MAQVRKNPAYSKADLRRWETDMVMKQPGGSGGPGFMQAANIVSFTCGDTDTGMLLVIRDAHNGTQTLSLNPVVAHALRAAVLTCGHAGQWLDKKAEVIVPTLPIG